MNEQAKELNPSVPCSTAEEAWERTKVLLKLLENDDLAPEYEIRLREEMESLRCQFPLQVAEEQGPTYIGCENVSEVPPSATTKVVEGLTFVRDAGSGS